MRDIQDGFVTIVNGRNLISFSTYLGGNSYDSVSTAELDPIGNVLITGVTHSNNFPTKHPIQLKKNRSEDAFLARMTLNGKFLFSTFIGGDYDDVPRAMKYVARSGVIYMVGDTESTRFPLINEYQSRNNGVLYWLDGFILAIHLRQ